MANQQIEISQSAFYVMNVTCFLQEILIFVSTFQHATSNKSLPVIAPDCDLTVDINRSMHAQDA